MEHSHPNFPELRCAEHKSPIILVSPQFNENEKNFFCSRCIAVGANKNNLALMVIEDFINYIATPSGINVPSSEEAQAIVGAKSTNVAEFTGHVNTEKTHIANLSEELRSQYQEKCNEMVTELKEVLEGQKGIYSNYYNRFQEEIAVDNELEAAIPKFAEIRDTVAKTEDLTEIENYLSRIVRQKEAWKIASSDLRTLGTRTEEFYKQQIDQISQNKPSFASKDAIIEIWTNGLNELIEKVKNQSGCFTNIYESTQGIVLNIQNPAEVALLTNEMIKADTELVLTLPARNLNLQQAQKIGAEIAVLSNLRSLTVNLSNVHVSKNKITSNEDYPIIEEIIKGVEQLTNLTSLTFNVYGNNLCYTFTDALGAALGKLVNLQTLVLELGMNDLNMVAIQNISQNLSGLTQLKSFTLDARYNFIYDVTALATAISSFNPALTNLNISLGGYSLAKNTLTAESAKLLVRSFRHLSNLTVLSLDLGYTGLDDSSAIELSQSLKDLSSLRKVNFQLYQNAIEARGAAKIAKRISKIAKLNNVVLNLNFNDKVKLDGAREIISTFRQNTHLNNLELTLVKVGVEKEQGINLKEDLTKNKLETPFEKVIVLF